MKTIKQAAKHLKSDYALSPSFYDELISSTEALQHIETTFIRAVEWAERWIPVEEELPKNDEFFGGKIVVLALVERFPCLAVYDDDRKNWYDPNRRKEAIEVTHWRPIKHK